MNERATVVATTTFAVDDRGISAGMDLSVTTEARLYLNRLTDLRIRQRRYQVVADVGDDLRIAQTGSGAQLLPFGVGPERLPDLVAAGQIFIRQHVRQVWLIGADERLAEEHGLAAGTLERADLAVIEHLDLLT